VVNCRDDCLKGFPRPIAAEVSLPMRALLAGARRKERALLAGLLAGCNGAPDTLPSRNTLEIIRAMKRIALLLLGAIAAAASAQTSSKPATTAARPAATTAHSTAASTAAKLPPGVPPVRGVVKTAFSLRYEDIKVGTGAVAAYIKTDTVHYTGWLAADGRKFDSSYERRDVVLDKDNKPVMGKDGKPQMGAPHPEAFTFVQGNPRLIPGWNLGIDGMKVGGKRRIFVPWQLAYGAQGRPGPDPQHEGIPAKADLIFDIELLNVKDTPMPANRPAIGGMPGGMAPHPGAPAPVNPVPARPAAPAAPAAPATPATPAAPATPAQPQTK
jgi:peptidylprolyl isomerase